MRTGRSITGEVAVDLGRDAQVLAPHEPLHGGQVGAVHEQEQRGRVAEVRSDVQKDLDRIKKDGRD